MFLTFKEDGGSMQDHYKYLIDGGYGLKILVYSGDDDAVCATIGTQAWVSDDTVDDIDSFVCPISQC